MTCFPGRGVGAGLTLGGTTDLHIGLFTINLNGAMLVVALTLDFLAVLNTLGEFLLEFGGIVLVVTVVLGNFSLFHGEGLALDAGLHVTLTTGFHLADLTVPLARSLPASVACNLASVFLSFWISTLSWSYLAPSFLTAF